MKNDEKTVIELLQAEMDNRGFISHDAIVKISKELNVSESAIYGVATFYSQFSLVPPAKYVISVCIGTACFVLGSKDILSALEEKLGIRVGETSKDGMFKIVGARCLGCCGFAPAVVLNGEIYGKMTKERINKLIDDILAKEKA